MEKDPAPTFSEVDRSPILESQIKVQNLLVLRAIVEVIEGVVQQTGTISESKVLTKRQSKTQVTDATQFDQVVELIPSTLSHLNLHDPKAFVIVTKSLADGSRNESWRSLLGLLVLDFYLDLIAQDGDHAWTVNALRLIGNCCIDSGLIIELEFRKSPANDGTRYQSKPRPSQSRHGISVQASRRHRAAG